MHAPRRPPRRHFAPLLLGCWLAARTAVAASSSPVALPQFTGLSSCQSSSCHGGGAGRDQCAIWTSRDFHARALAILLTPRSQRMCDTLHLGNAPASPSCTVCHSPMQAVARERLLPAAHLDEGVSCESCHAPAGNWLRSHTRLDYTYAQKVASGMSDLRNVYRRANLCVACHESLPPNLAAAGHPELRFELDSQSVSEPPHWRETDPWIGLHSWLAGQAVAFREESWHLLEDPAATSPRWEALGWLLQEVTAEIPSLPRIEIPRGQETDFGRRQADANRLAKAAADFAWTPALARHLRQRLAQDGGALRNESKDRQLQRARVLAQGLDRLSVQLARQGDDRSGAAGQLDALFADLRDPLNFDANKFCADLKAFAR